MSESLADLLSDAVPGYTVRLPTLGLFNSSSDFKEGFDPDNVFVRPFSVFQDLHYRSPSLIMTGKATFSMINTVCPEILKPESMANCDIETLMIAARIASYGTKMTVNFDCTNPELGEDGKPTCVHKSNYIIDLERMLLDYPSLSIEEIQDWNVVLHGSKGKNFVIHLRLPRYDGVVNIMKFMAKHSQLSRLIQSPEFETLGEPQQSKINDDMIENLANANFVKLFSCIHKIEVPDGRMFTDPAEITAALNNKAFPGSWTSVIDKKIDSLVGRFNKAGTQDVTCEKCNHVTKDVSILSDPTSFFTQDSPQ